MRRMAAVFGVVLAAAACSDETEAPAGPEEPEFGTLTVDASADWAFVAFEGETAATRSVAAPSSSEVWDVGFYATSVMLNGGAAGPAGVVGHCLCQNASATDAELTAMTADSELSDFEAVTAADIPSEEESWASDALAPAIDGWYSYDPATHVVSAAPENVWKVRTASGEAYAAFHVTGLENAAREHAGQVTFEYALQTSPGGPLGAPQTHTVDLSGGPVYFDLESGSEVGSGDAWDLQFAGYDVRVNGGVSGSGQAGATLAGVPFAQVTDPGDLAANHYAADAFGGVFDANPWYRYNIEGNHQIWPTFDVFLVKRGEAVYKVQLTGYYSATGDSRHISFRYARLN